MTGRQRNGIDPNPHAEQRPEVGGATGTTRQPLAAEARKVERVRAGATPGRLDGTAPSGGVTEAGLRLKASDRKDRWCERTTRRSWRRRIA
jgi:hypothetical protein